jgi:tetratricopeptide (TPR) repeat protein
MNTNVADALDALGHELVSCRGERVESAALINQALTIRTQLLGSEHAQVATSLQHLGEVQISESKLIEAEELFQRALAMRRRLFGNEHVEVAESLATLAQMRTWQARQDEAEAYAREALAILSRVAPDPRALLAGASAQRVLGEILRRQGRVEEALELQRAAMKICRSLLGSAHPDYAATLNNLASALLSANQLGEAETAVREALAINRTIVGDLHSRTRFCLETLAKILRQAGRFAEAETAYREAFPRGLCPGLIMVLRAQGKIAEAEARMASVASEARQAVEVAKTLPPSEVGVSARCRLAAALWYQGRIAESEPALDEALDIANRLAASATLLDGLSFQAMRNAALEVWFGRQSEHTALCQRWLTWAEAQPQFTPKGRAAAMVNLGPVSDPQLRARANDLARQALEAAPTNALLVWYRLNLGVAAFRLERYPEAERMLLQSEQDGPGTWHPAARTCTSKFFRAMMLFRQGRKDAARRLSIEAEAETPPLPAEVHWSLAEGADYDDLMLWLAYKEARALLKP